MDEFEADLMARHIREPKGSIAREQARRAAKIRRGLRNAFFLSMALWYVIWLILNAVEII
ncbi:MAG: hypothetical protein AAF415_13070 [Pseudomonadota bacterium]